MSHFHCKILQRFHLLHFSFTLSNLSAVNSSPTEQMSSPDVRKPAAPETPWTILLQVSTTGGDRGGHWTTFEERLESSQTLLVNLYGDR